jgi:hypothetical protein
LFILLLRPNSILIQLRKKNEGPSKYKSIKKTKTNIGYKSNRKAKNRNSDIKKIDPGNPRKTKQFSRDIKNNLGHIKFTPFNSVISLVLNFLFIESTNRNELVDKNAWLINIQNPAKKIPV